MLVIPILLEVKTGNPLAGGEVSEIINLPNVTRMRETVRLLKNEQGIELSCVQLDICFVCGNVVSANTTIAELKRLVADVETCHANYTTNG